MERLLGFEVVQVCCGASHVLAVTNLHKVLNDLIVLRSTYYVTINRLSFSDKHFGSNSKITNTTLLNVYHIPIPTHCTLDKLRTKNILLSYLNKINKHTDSIATTLRTARFLCLYLIIYVFNTIFPLSDHMHFRQNIIL